MLLAHPRAAALRISGLVACAMLAVACGDRDAWRAANLQFQAPHAHKVVAGDSMVRIAKANGISPTDIRAWNAIAPDQGLHVGQHVWIWDLDAVAAPAVAAHGTPKAGAPAVAGSAPKVRPSKKASLQLPFLGGGTAEPEPTAAPTEAELERQSILAGEYGSYRNAGLLGVATDDAGLDPTLAANVDRLGNAHVRVGTSLDARSGALNGDYAAVDTVDAPSARVVGTAAQSGIPQKPVVTPRLPVAPRKACLGGPSGSDLGDDGMATSNGLSASQVRTTMAGLVKWTMRCFPAGSHGKYSVEVGLVVGCDGRVSSVWTVDAGGVPANVSACIEAVVRQGSFPAHDLPDGQELVLPLSYGF